VRFRTGGIGPSGGPEMTDVIGHVRASDADSVTVERRDGTVTTVAWSDVVACKVVPDQRR
jgi:hypothetical protein